jgi:predicted transcriptional regulator
MIVLNNNNGKVYMNSINLFMDTDCTCRNLLECIYNLSSSDIDILILLLRSEEPLTLEILSKQMRKDKGTVFRSLQKLVSIGFCVKENRNLRGGGQYHVYHAASIDLIEKATEHRLKEIQKSLSKLIRRFKEDIQQMIEQ